MTLKEECEELLQIHKDKAYDYYSHFVANYPCVLVDIPGMESIPNWQLTEFLKGFHKFFLGKFYDQPPFFCISIKAESTGKTAVVFDESVSAIQFKLMVEDSKDISYRYSEPSDAK
jgi:hypothetical protein